MLYRFAVHIDVARCGSMSMEVSFDPRPTIAEIEARVWEAVERDPSACRIIEGMGEAGGIVGMHVKAPRSAVWVPLRVGSQLQDGSEVRCEVGEVPHHRLSGEADSLRVAAVNASTAWRMLQSDHLHEDPAPRQTPGPLLRYVPESFEVDMQQHRHALEQQRLQRRQSLLGRRH